MTLDPMIVTLIGGQVVTVISAVSAAIVAIITAVKLNNVREQQAITANSLLTVAKDTEAIKGHVNSEKTAADGREITLKKERDMLREQLAIERQNAALLAQALASAKMLAVATETPRDRHRASDLPVLTDALRVPTVEPALKAIEAIEVHTGETVELLKQQVETNTARTE